jgi:hypothetical protein
MHLFYPVIVNGKGATNPALTSRSRRCQNRRSDPIRAAARITPAVFRRLLAEYRIGARKVAEL